MWQCVLITLVYLKNILYILKVFFRAFEETVDGIHV